MRASPSREEPRCPTIRAGEAKQPGRPSADDDCDGRRRGARRSDPRSGVEARSTERAAPSPFPPIADHAFLSNCYTGALVAQFGFLPRADEHLHISVLAIADELSEDGFIPRYRTDETDDGLSGKEGSFLICSFWLVSALAIVGEEQRAVDPMERLLRVASPLGLYAEEFDVDTGRHLGNLPQAFSHVALIEAAARMVIAEMRDELF